MFCVFWLKKIEKHKDNSFTAELVKCFFTVPWAGLISAGDSFPLTLVGSRYPFLTTATGRNTKIAMLTDNASTCLDL